VRSVCYAWVMYASCVIACVYILVCVVYGVCVVCVVNMCSRFVCLRVYVHVCTCVCVCVHCVCVSCVSASFCASKAHNFPWQPPVSSKAF